MTLFYWDNWTDLQLVPCRRLLAAPASFRPVQLRAPVLNQSLLCHLPQAAAATCCRVSARSCSASSKAPVHNVCSNFLCCLMAQGLRTYEHRVTCRCGGFVSWFFWLNGCMFSVYACSLCFSNEFIPHSLNSSCILVFIGLLPKNLAF